MIANRWRKQGAPVIEREEFLLQSADDRQQRKLEAMVSQLTKIAATKPPGYKRKRPRQPSRRST